MGTIFAIDPFWPALASDRAQTVYFTLAMWYKFTLNVFFIQNNKEIFKVLKYNWRIVLVNLEQMVQKEKGKMNERNLKKWSKLKNHDQEIPEKINIVDIQKNFSETSTKIVILTTYQKKKYWRKPTSFIDISY